MGSTAVDNAVLQELLRKLQEASDNSQREMQEHQKKWKEEQDEMRKQRENEKIEMAATCERMEREREERDRQHEERLDAILLQTQGRARSSGQIETALKKLASCAKRRMKASGSSSFDAEFDPDDPDSGRHTVLEHYMTRTTKQDIKEKMSHLIIKGDPYGDATKDQFLKLSVRTIGTVYPALDFFAKYWNFKCLGTQNGQGSVQYLGGAMMAKRLFQQTAKVIYAYARDLYSSSMVDRCANEGTLPCGLTPTPEVRSNARSAAKKLHLLKENKDRDMCAWLHDLRGTLATIKDGPKEMVNGSDVISGPPKIFDGPNGDPFGEPTFVEAVTGVFEIRDPTFKKGGRLEVTKTLLLLLAYEISKWVSGDAGIGTLPKETVTKDGSPERTAYVHLYHGCTNWGAVGAFKIVEPFDYHTVYKSTCPKEEDTLASCKDWQLRVMASGKRARGAVMQFED